MVRPARDTLRRGAAALTGAVLAASLAACSGDEGPAPQAEPGASSSAPGGEDAVEPLATKATVGRMVGTLSQKGRGQLRRRVTSVVDAWIDAAYVGGDFPRDDFGDAFATFSPGAARRAKADRALMSNAVVGPRVDAVEAVNRRLRIDVLAVKGRAVGVTARVVLGLRLSGEVDRKDRISGSLYLTYDKGWRVFGYDMDRGAV